MFMMRGNAKMCHKVNWKEIVAEEEEEEEE